MDILCRRNPFLKKNHPKLLFFKEKPMKLGLLSPSIAYLVGITSWICHIRLSKTFLT